MDNPGSDEPTLLALQAEVRQFRDERDWEQFHTLKDLAAALAIEAAELQEELLWVRPDQEVERLEERRAEIAAELADVVIVALNFAEAASIDIAGSVRLKLSENARRYPVEDARGKARKSRHSTDDADS